MKRRVAKLEILIARDELLDVSPDLEGLRDLGAIGMSVKCH
jgi:hypothetical protein